MHAARLLGLATAASVVSACSLIDLDGLADGRPSSSASGTRTGSAGAAGGGGGAGGSVQTSAGGAGGGSGTLVFVDDGLDGECWWLGESRP